MLALLVSVVVLNLIAFLIPKKLSRLEMYVTSLFSVYFACQVDVYLNLKLNLYGYFLPGVDYRTLIILWGLYPAFSIIFLNLYPYALSRFYKLAYILMMSFLCVFLEWVYSREFGFFYHADWKLIHSMFAYPFILGILLLHLYLIRKFFDSRQR